MKAGVALNSVVSVGVVPYGASPYTAIVEMRSRRSRRLASDASDVGGWSACAGETRVARADAASVVDARQRRTEKGMRAPDGIGGVSRFSKDTRSCRQRSRVATQQLRDEPRTSPPSFSCRSAGTQGVPAEATCNAQPRLRPG